MLISTLVAELCSAATSNSLSSGEQAFTLSCSFAESAPYLPLTKVRWDASSRPLGQIVA